MNTALLICLALVTVAVSNAALPPLSDADRKEGATLIAVGRVTKIERSERAGHDTDWVDEVITITLAVEMVEKGQPLKEVLVTGWQIKKRPRGWAGPGGQHWMPTEGDRVRVYGKATTSEMFSLLEPNGIDKIDGPASQPSTAPSR